MVRNGATFDHQSDEVLGVAWIENPIHNRPQATVLGDMALQRCWHPRIQDPVAHRRKEAAEVGEIKGVLRIFDLPMGQELVGLGHARLHGGQPAPYTSAGSSKRVANDPPVAMGISPTTSPTVSKRAAPITRPATIFTPRQKATRMKSRS